MDVTQFVIHTRAERKNIVLRQPFWLVLVFEIISLKHYSRLISVYTTGNLILYDSSLKLAANAEPNSVDLVS